MAKVTNLNKDISVLTSKAGQYSLNSLYELLTTNHVLDHVHAIMMSDRPSESINNVYKLSSIAPVIRYLHADAGFPTKATFPKAIRRGNYLMWPLATVKKCIEAFPIGCDVRQAISNAAITERRGKQTDSIYVTKHHAKIHHRAIRPEFLTPKCQLDLLIKKKSRLK